MNSPQLLPWQETPSARLSRPIREEVSRTRKTTEHREPGVTVANSSTNYISVAWSENRGHVNVPFRKEIAVA